MPDYVLLKALIRGRERHGNVEELIGDMGIWGYGVDRMNKLVEEKRINRWMCRIDQWSWM